MMLRRKWTLLFYIVLAGFLIFIVPMLPAYILTFATSVLIYSIYVSGANLLTGYTGLVSLGQAMFWGTAGFLVGILTTNGIIHNFYLMALICIVGVAILGASFGALAIRVRKLYFMIVTFAFGHVIWSLAMYPLQPYTYGFNGIRNVPRPDLGLPVSMENNVYFYYLVLVITALSFFFLYLVIKSPLGHASMGIRDNEHRMIALGYDTYLYKYVSYILSAILAGVGGMLYAYFNSYVNVTELHWLWSGDALIMVFIGGIGTYWGPILGALVYTGLRYWVSAHTMYWYGIEGIIFVLVVLYFRGGIVGFLTELSGRLRESKR